MIPLRDPMSRLSDACSQLTATDAAIDRVAPERRSLDPERRRARTLTAVAMANLAGDDRIDRVFVQALAKLGDAQVCAFPDNIFWDFDAVAASMRAQASTSADPAERIDRLADLACRLMARFGRASPIRFRYVHDFMYGYDWARWVARDPHKRQSVGPFDMTYLQYVFDRGQELITLIERGDAKYGPIVAGKHRNPFRFSREPEDERRLFEDLAERALVPVTAWNRAYRADWNRPYALLREERARALGIGRV